MLPQAEAGFQPEAKAGRGALRPNQAKLYFRCLLVSGYRELASGLPKSSCQSPWCKPSARKPAGQMVPQSPPGRYNWGS